MSPSHFLFMAFAAGLVVASPFLAMRLPSWRYLGSPTEDVGGTRWLILPLATLSAGAGAIHLMAIEAHFAEWPVFGLFFIGAAIFQLGWAVAYQRSPTAPIAGLGLGVNLAIVALWLVTRTVGLPFGPFAGLPEAIETSDAVATLFEAGLVVGLAVLLVPAWRRAVDRLRVPVPSASLAVAMAMVAISLVATFAIVEAGSHGTSPQTAPTVDADQPIDLTRLGKFPADVRARIAEEQASAGSNDVECVGECGP